MVTWVLPGILNAEDVTEIAPELLHMTSKISTGVIVGYVNKFIETYENSSDSTYSLAAKKLKEAYADVNSVMEYLQSDEARNLADTLCSLQYSDISADVPKDKLIAYRSAILELFSEDVDFMKEYQKEVEVKEASGYKTAYTAKLDKENFDRVVTQMQAYLSQHPDKAGGMLVDRITKNSNLFINSRAKTNAPTVLRKAIYRKDTLKNILRGLDYLIDKIDSGQAPRSWRIV